MPSTYIVFVIPPSDSQGRYRGKQTRAITYGHSKARRPDLKQLLYVLTLSEDGGVPVHMATHNGNLADDQTHIETWNLLCELVGGPDFLYVADCKLASQEHPSSRRAVRDGVAGHV